MSAKESAFLQSLRTAEKTDIKALAKLLAPYMAEAELVQPRIWGDPQRLHLDEATIHVNDLLVNTRSGHVTIKADCFFGHRCMLLTGTHDYTKLGMERLKSVPSEGRDIVVEKGAWLGSDVTVLGPVVIGENSVVAAGSLVTRDVPKDTIVAGRPAVPVKNIRGDEKKGGGHQPKEIVKAAKEVAFSKGFVAAKQYVKDNFLSVHSCVYDEDISFPANREEAAKKVLILGSKPESYIPEGVDIVFGANRSFSYYDVKGVERKVCVWGSLGLHILDDILSSDVDEVIALGHEPKTFPDRRGRVKRKSGFGEIEYEVMTFFERREVVEKVSGRRSPFIHDNFFLLDEGHQENLILDSLAFVDNAKDSLGGCYDWPLPWRPSAGVFALVLAIKRFGKCGEYFLAGIGCDQRSSYQAVARNVKSMAENQNKNMVDRYGIDAHVSADIEVLKALVGDYNISTTDEHLAEVVGMRFYKE